MKMLYKVEGTIWYKDSEAEVQSLQAYLLEGFGISSDMLIKNEKSTRKSGLQFSFYKKEDEYGFEGAIISLLQSGMTPEEGEIIFMNPHYGERQYCIAHGGWFIAAEYCS